MFYLCSAQITCLYNQDMNKLQLAFLVAACLILTMVNAEQDKTHFYHTPVTAASGNTAITLFDVRPHIDTLLKAQYWYYLRAANTLYEASVDSPSKYLFFTIYRNIVGTFLVITTWTKADQYTQVNTFVRLGNGFEAGSGAHYDPVNIDPFIVSLALGPDEYMVVVNADGTISVTGNKALFDQIMGNKTAGTGTNGDNFDLAAEMKSKCAFADTLNREQYWYYLDKAELVSESDIPTNEQYYCVFVYVNKVGTFLSISHWNLQTKTAGINTLVRLGNGQAPGANYGPVELSPSILQLTQFN